VDVNPNVANLLFDEARSEVEKSSGVSASGSSQRPQRLHLEQFRIYSSNAKFR